MGASFGSVHLRTDDREAVRAAAETVAKKHRMKFLLAPTIDGWTTLFPSSHGQDEQSSHTLASLVPQIDILHLVLHDDDIFAYGFFRGGRLVDEYNSCPDYFGEVPQADHDRQRGRPERFADLLGSRLSEAQLILTSVSGDAGGQFERFAKLLHLPNAATAYEYLMDEERDEIVRFDEFLPIPDPAAERSAKKAKAAAVALATKTLQAEGKLLAEMSGGKGPMLAPRPIACAAGKNDFLVCWSKFPPQEPLDLLHFESKDFSQPTSTGIRLDSHLHSIAASRCGRYMIATHASGKWNSELWDLADRKKVMAVQHTAHSVGSAVFSNDGSLLITKSDDEVKVIDPTKAAILRSIPIPRQGQHIGIHPSNKFAVVDSIGQPVILDLAGGRVLKRLLVGGRCDPAAQLAAISEGWLTLTTDPAQKAEFKKKMEEALAWSIRAEKDVIRGNEVMRDIEFSADGRYLLLATSAGARVYEWSSVLASEAGGAMPAPIYAAKAEPVTYELGPGHEKTSAYTNSVAYDARHHRMLLAGIEGTLGSIDLSTGRQQLLLEVPGRPPISYMDLSYGGEVICLRFTPVHFERSNKTPWKIQFWRYPFVDATPANNA